MPLSSSSSSWSRDREPGRACPRPLHLVPTAHTLPLRTLPSSTPLLAPLPPPLWLVLEAALRSPSHVRIPNPHSSARTSPFCEMKTLQNEEWRLCEMKTLWVAVTVKRVTRSRSTVYSAVGLPIYFRYIYSKKAQENPVLDFLSTLGEQRWGLDIKFLEFCFVYLQKRSLSRISVQFKFQKYQTAYLCIQTPALTSSQARQLLPIELIRSTSLTSSFTTLYSPSAQLKV